MNLKQTLGAGLVSAWIAALGPSAFAGPVAHETGSNQVTNGSFENTSAIAGSGWTASGFIAEGFDYFIDTNPADAQSGTHSFAGGGIGAPGFISQNFATVVGRITTSTFGSRISAVSPAIRTIEVLLGR